jgi:hypothetical protein
MSSEKRGFEPKIIKGENKGNKECLAEVCFDLSRKEKHNFIENDIIDQIKKLISEEGFIINDLKAIKKIEDKNGNIVYLKIDANVTKDDAIENLEYEFMIEGEYSSDSSDYISDKTEIFKIKDEMPKSVARYEENEWKSNEN